MCISSLDFQYTQFCFSIFLYQSLSDLVLMWSAIVSLPVALVLLVELLRFDYTFTPCYTNACKITFVYCVTNWNMLLFGRGGDKYSVAMEICII